ncbi:MAG TPA: flagellar biosynthesis anti-sigma factor FlgM [Bryobacteraceae bacterium]|nr:flagellar biosynthesis anti-sigma factor FlgM [Bryobacteraceae bacterium]
MRVDEQSPNQQVSSSPSRAAESQRIQVDSGRYSGSAASAGADHVDLSGLAGRISQTMHTLSAQSAQRVGQLRQDFQAGRYQPDAQQLSRAVMR